MFQFRLDSSGTLSPGVRAMTLIRGGFNIAYDCVEPTPMVLSVHVRPERHADMVEAEVFTVYPEIPYEIYTDLFGNVCTRLVAPPGRLSLWNRFVIADSGLPEELPFSAYQHNVSELPPETITFLLASRYCETEKLMPLAWSLFGNTWEGWPRVVAILNYVHHRISFNYQNARWDRTAFEAHEEGTGVCRDYAHLAIAFFRCMNIPARYCTGYLGDIGVPADPSPMDFHAWIEVYLGGRWWTLDARHNKPRIGRILIARGRDAADVAIATTFGQANLVEFKVITEPA